MNTFPEQLAAARQLVAAVRAGHLPPPPDHQIDQLHAATQDAHAGLLRLETVVTTARPDRGWKSAHKAASSETPNEVNARVFVAVAPAVRCVHLRRGGPQPAWARLALRRVDCAACVQTVRLPPAGEDDRCDWCGARGVEIFVPVAVQTGPMIVAGDACDDCAKGLRLPEMGAT